MIRYITAAKGEPHVTSTDAAVLNAAVIGPDSYVFDHGNRLAATMIDTNTLRILSGEATTCGHAWRVDGYEEVIIENGTPGYKRTDLVVARVSSSPMDEIEFRVLKGEETTGDPEPPAYLEGDLNDGDTVVEMPLYSVTRDGINAEEPVPLFETLGSLKAQKDAWDSQSHERSFVELGGGVTLETSGSVGILRLDTKDNLTAGAYNNLCILPENARPDVLTYAAMFELKQGSKAPAVMAIDPSGLVRLLPTYGNGQCTGSTTLIIK